MHPLKKRASELQARIQSAYETLNIDALIAESQTLEAELADGSIWDSPERAQVVAKKASDVKVQIEPWQR